MKENKRRRTWFAMPISYCASARQFFMLRLVFIQLKDCLVCSKCYLNPDLLSPLRLDCTSLCFFQQPVQNAVFQIFSASLPLPLLSILPQHFYPMFSIVFPKVILNRKFYKKE